MNLFELFCKIGVDDQASGKLKDISGKLGNGLKTAAKIGTAAVGAAAAGITALTTAAVNNYAEYEQLVGGVDTLFKDASQKVQKYASEAYRTSGMSANDYMANATAFSASLISSLGDDTEAATEYANRAMVSMSDNANKMGTNIDSIVQTYQSLARGNFAMLDNLKLGYGGTKAELERLIADAASYTEIQKEMGITVDASSTSFDNIVNAIAVVQGKLGIAGATALEAGTTIEGSVNSMKAAWDNLITGVANKNADLEGLINNLVTSIVGDGTDSNLGVLGNIMPAVKQALNGASKLVQGLLPKIVQEIPSIINENLPILAEAAISIIRSLVDGISQSRGTLITTIFDTMKFLINSVVSMLPEIVQLGIDLIGSLSESISGNLPSIASTIIENLANILKDSFPDLIETAISLIGEIANSLPKIIEKITKVIPDLFNVIANSLLTDGLPVLAEIAVELIKSLLQVYPEVVRALTLMLNDFFSILIPAIVESLPILIKALPSILNELFKALPSILLMGFLSASPLSLIFLAIYSMISNNWDNIKNFFSENIPKIVDNIISWLKSFPEKIGFVIGKVIKFFMDLPGNIENWLLKTIDKIKNWADNMKRTVQEKIPEITNKIKEFFSDLPDKIEQVGKDIVNGLWNGINNGWKWMKNKVKNLVNDLISGVKKGLGIASPSKVFKKLGFWTADGFGIGFEDEFAHVKDDMEDALNFDDASVGINASIRNFGAGAAGGSFGGTSIGNITINIDGAQYSDEQSLAKAVAEAIQTMTDRRAAVYA